MTNQEKWELHESICKEMTTLYKAKSSDYGNSVEQLYKDLGPISLLTRLGDKYNRLKFLMVNENKRKVKDESITDTLMDLANYAILAMITLEEEKRDKDPYDCSVDNIIHVGDKKYHWYTIPTIENIDQITTKKLLDIEVRRFRETLENMIGYKGGK